MSSVEINPYDEVPYPGQPLSSSHPARLAAIAAMFDLHPPDVACCRVLELGCANGENLIPMAERHRESHFVGIDYSQVQIATARRIGEALDLTNLELHHANIADLDDALGKFDYIIVHGVYTWVPRDVQDKILKICRTALSAQGLAFVTHNIYPAWHVRSIIRYLVCRQVRQIRSGTQQIAQCMAILELLAKAVAADEKAPTKLLKSELDLILRHPGGYLCHEYLERDNEPLYFHEFIDRVAAAGLRYVRDADLAWTFPSNFRPAVEQHLRRLAADPIAVEQYSDVLRHRGFRQTILCHREISPSHDLQPARLEEMYFAGQFTPQNKVPDLKLELRETFVMRQGQTITQSPPLVKAILFYVGSQWPRALSIAEMTQGAATLLAPDGDPSGTQALLREPVVQILSQCLMRGILEPSSVPDSFITSVSRRPMASPLARFQAQTPGKVTNRRHEQVQLDDAARYMLPYLDGQHDHGVLLGALVDVVGRGELTLPPGFDCRGGKVPDALASAIEQWLTVLASQALLIA